VGSNYTSDAEEYRALKKAYDQMRQVPYFVDSTNSNSFAHQLLINAGFSVPTDTKTKWQAITINEKNRDDPIRAARNPTVVEGKDSPADTVGWKYVDGYVFYTYGGRWYDKYGKMTSEYGK
jgi:hypothetical protein